MFEWLPYIAFLASVAAVIAGAMHVRGHEPARLWMHRASLLAAGLSAVTFLVLVALFILVRTDIQTVFLYTSTEIPLRYRIAGAWAGRDGSMVLWAMYAAMVAAVVMVRHRRTPRPDDTGRAWTELGLAAIATAFLGAVAWQDTFAATDSFLLQNRPQGNGLNPTLLSPFILIHPPVMFVAYALTAVPLAAVVADQITGRQEWSTTGMLWSRVDWLLYTFAMGLGGIWAYYTLGFGGYWAWDPVEVANLLPWLALTLFLHAQLHHRRHGRYQHLGPFLAVLPFFLTIFSTISTRSGLWVSVHAFTDPTDTFDPDAASRFLAILGREPGLQFHVGLMLSVTLLFLALWARRMAHDTGRLQRPMQVVAGIWAAAAVVAALAPITFLGLIFDAADALLGGRMGFGLLAVLSVAVLAPAAPLLVGEDGPTKWRLDMQRLLLVSLIVLGVGLLVIFLWHIAAVNGWSTESYMGRFPYLATPVFLGLLVFQGHAMLRKNVWWLLGATAALAAIAAVVSGRTGYLIVLAVALVLVSIARVLHVAPKLPRNLAIARGSLWVAALLDVLFWLNPPTIRLGLEWTPQWPIQLIMGAAAFFALHRATELLCGRVRHAGQTHLLVGVLGAFYIAPIVAVASWIAHRRSDPRGVSSPRPRLHQVGLHGVHLAVAIVLLGYVLSTYLGVEQDLTLEPGEAQMLGGSTVLLEGTDIVTDDRRIDRFEPRIQVTGQGTTTASATFYWEPQGGSHYPLPATARLWDRDVYFAVDAICIDPSGDCDQARDFVRAYEPGQQLPAGIQVHAIQVQAFSLPGIALVWGGLFVFLYAMGLTMVTGREH